MKHPLFLYEPGATSGLLPGSSGIGGGEAGYFRLPGLLSPGVAVGADTTTCSPAGVCEWAPAPGPAPAGGPPRTLDSHWLDVAFFWYCSGWVEEAFFWPKNNTRVSAGTSLLHPLPSIVSPTQSQASKSCAAGRGLVVSSQGEISNVCDGPSHLSWGS